MADDSGSERCSDFSKVTQQRLNPDLDCLAFPLPRAPPAPVAFISQVKGLGTKQRIWV